MYILVHLLALYYYYYYLLQLSLHPVSVVIPEGSLHTVFGGVSVPCRLTRLTHMFGLRVGQLRWDL
jgi:hypothetical protein